MPKKSTVHTTKKLKETKTEKLNVVPATKPFPTFIFVLSVFLFVFVLFLAMMYTIGRNTMKTKIQFDASEVMRLEDDLQNVVDDYITDIEDFTRELETSEFTNEPDPEKENFLSGSEVGSFEETLSSEKDDSEVDSDLFSREPEF